MASSVTHTHIPSLSFVPTRKDTSNNKGLINFYGCGGVIERSGTQTVRGRGGGGGGNETKTDDIFVHLCVSLLDIHTLMVAPLGYCNNAICHLWF